MRLLIELVRERTADEARATARRVEAVLDETGTRTPRLLHGEGPVAWSMLGYALERGYDVRMGLEDTLVLPDGRSTRDNAELVRVALECASLVGKATHQEQATCAKEHNGEQ